MWENSVENCLLSRRSIQFPVSDSTFHGLMNAPDCLSSRCLRGRIFNLAEVRFCIECLATSVAMASRESYPMNIDSAGSGRISFLSETT